MPKPNKILLIISSNFFNCWLLLPETKALSLAKSIVKHHKQINCYNHNSLSIEFNKLSHANFKNEQ